MQPQNFISSTLNKSMGFLEENERKRIVDLFSEGDGWILLKIKEKVMVVRERRKKRRYEKGREGGC